MKDRWQKSLEAAVAAYDTDMPWERGARRKDMITRRQRRIKESAMFRKTERQSA